MMVAEGFMDEVAAAGAAVTVCDGTDESATPENVLSRPGALVVGLVVAIRLINEMGWEVFIMRSIDEGNVGA